MATRIEIHPGIGIARVGPSDEFYLSPEPEVTAPETYRDSPGRLKRQAARFRLFSCDRDANGVLTAARELGPADGAITWTAHLVNRKGAAPNFAKPGGGRRNHATGDDAQDAPLIIDPGPRSVSGLNAPPVPFDTGTFMGTIVPLGDIRTDARGRLLVCGGRGRSDWVRRSPIRTCRSRDSRTATAGSTIPPTDPSRRQSGCPTVRWSPPSPRGWLSAQPTSPPRLRTSSRCTRRARRRGAPGAAPDARHGVVRQGHSADPRSRSAVPVGQQIREAATPARVQATSRRMERARQSRQSAGRGAGRPRSHARQHADADPAAGGHESAPLDAPAARREQ